MTIQIHLIHLNTSMSGVMFGFARFILNINLVMLVNNRRIRSFTKINYNNRTQLLFFSCVQGP